MIATCVSSHLPDVGVLVRGAGQDVSPIRTEARLDEEGGGGMTSEGGCRPNVGPESVVQVVHAVAHAHQQPPSCKKNNVCAVRHGGTEEAWILQHIHGAWDHTE